MRELYGIMAYGFLLLSLPLWVKFGTYLDTLAQSWILASAVRQVEEE